MKKVIITITILSFFNFIGCFYTEQMNPHNYNYDENEALKIIVKDSAYNINSGDYYFDNDTVFATIRTKIDAQSTLKTDMEIPVEEIETIEIERTDVLATTLLALGITIGVLVVIFLIGFDMNLKLDSSGSGSEI